jgi:3,4-dihydroxy 2-butanone 4-phosphate synthase/GTP cyclohydrolase II
VSALALAHATIDTAVGDVAAGRMVVVLDDHADTADLVMAAELVTPDDVNFMTRRAGGWVRLTLTCGRCAELGIGLMASTDTAARGLALAVTIEAAQGVTTGISTADQAHTMRTAVDPAKGRADLVVPGHVRPVMARDGGVLERPGSAEASIDLARLAGHRPAAVLCGIQNDDGSMAGVAEAEDYAARYAFTVVSIAALLAHRRGAASRGPRRR